MDDHAESAWSPTAALWNDTSRPSLHDLQSDIQAMMAQILSLDAPSADWDARLSELQDISMQLNTSHLGGTADMWQSFEMVQAYLADVIADFAEYITQRDAQQQQARRTSAAPLLQQQQARLPHEEHVQLQVEHHQNQADDVGLLPLTAAMQLFGLHAHDDGQQHAQLQRRHHDLTRELLQTEGLAPLGELLLPMLGSVLGHGLHQQQQQQQHHRPRHDDDEPVSALLQLVGQVFRHI